MEIALLAVIVVLLIALFLSECMRVAFYRSYFRERQIVQGNDPDEVVKELFPWVWWIIR